MDKPLRIMRVENQYETPDPMITGVKSSGLADWRNTVPRFRVW